MKYPSTEAKELYRTAVRMVWDNPGLFAEAGRRLDDPETGYSDIALRRRRAAFKRQWHRRGRQERRTNTHFGTRSGWKKIYTNGSKGDPPWPKPRSKAVRLAEAWSDTVGQLNTCPLDQRVAQSREDLAARIILISWLMADPDANQWDVTLTEFQRWDWNAGGGKSPLKYKAWLGESEQEPGIDDSVGRYALYDNYLINQEDLWLPHLREAVREMTQLIDSHDRVEKALDMAHAKPGTFALLADRLREMPRRQPPPTNEQARLEINSICAQAVMYYKDRADAGVPQFDKSLVNFSLTGDPSSDQKTTLNNDAGSPRWLDIAVSVSKHFPGRVVPDPGAPTYFEQSRPDVVIGTTSGPEHEWTERYVTEKTYPPENWPQRASEYADVLECLDELAMRQQKGPSAAQASAVLVNNDVEPTHSEDFTSVEWFGTRYSFSKGNQAQAVRVLWEAWAQGEHSLSQESIGERIKSSADRFEMRKTFRQRKAEGKGYEAHPAWGTMIKQYGKGCFRLACPKCD